MSTGGSRNRNIVLAGVLAAVAGVLTMLSVGGGEDGAAKAQSGATAPVLVAARDLQVGLSLDEALASGAVTTKKVNAEVVEPNAILNPAAVRGRVVIQPIYKGEQVTLVRLGQTAQQGLRAQLSGTLRAMRVPGTAEQLLAGTVRTGDHVDVVASVKAGQQQTPYSSVAIRNLLVLEAASPSSDATAATDQLAATLQLTDAQAQRLFYVLKNGEWSFLLRPATRVRAAAGSPTSASSLLAGR